MPRKFLGQRIERGVDVLRPPSLTLTADDIANIPPIPSSGSEESLVLGDGEIPKERKVKRLSKRYGGTIYFKKRLESVPEIFLHDFKKRQQDSAPQKHMPADLVGVARMPTIKERYTQGRISPNNRRVLQRAQRQAPSAAPYRYVSERPAPPFTRSNELHPNIKARKAPYPTEGTLPKAEMKYHHPNYTRSTNEILFDEILEAYAADKDDDSIPSLDNNNMPCYNKNSVLNNEVERVLEHVQKHQNMVEMQKRVKALDNIDENSDDSASLESAKRHAKHLSDLISTQDESGEASSEAWTEGEESSSESNQEGYETAIETLPSSIEVEDLHIHDEPLLDDVSYTEKPNKLVHMSLKKITINPKILEVDYDDNDEEEEELATTPVSLAHEMRMLKVILPTSSYESDVDTPNSNDTIAALRAKIDNISLVDVEDRCSVSSSVYS